jgi:ribosomal protein S18 acetylase RimI-like enzyme
MTKFTLLHNKPEIEAYFRQNTALHLYEIGDLDDYFWGHTTWYAVKDDQRILQIALLYSGDTLPVLLALADPPIMNMEILLRSAIPFLPRKFYVHLSEDMDGIISDYYQLEFHGTFNKMLLRHPSRLRDIDTSEVVRLDNSDLEDMMILYQTSYPGNWFDPKILDTGQFFGIRRNTQLVSVAGIHVYSPEYQIAALGNITTHPQFRGKGLATSVCARLCQSLWEKEIDHIGLNVKSDNMNAITSYKKFGFEHVGTYQEYTASQKTT